MAPFYRYDKFFQKNLGGDHFRIFIKYQLFLGSSAHKKKGLTTQKLFRQNFLKLVIFWCFNTQKGTNHTKKGFKAEIFENKPFLVFHNI